LSRPIIVISKLGINMRNIFKILLFFNLISNSAFAQKYSWETFAPFTFCNDPRDSNERSCKSFEVFYKIDTSNFDILGDFTISMSLDDILKQCTYRFRGGGVLAGGKTIESALFRCKNDKLSKESSIELGALYYDNIKALQLGYVIYETCSPPWAEIKPKIIEKYSPKSSRFTVDLSANNTSEDSLRFYANVDEFEKLTVFHQKNNKKCPGGLGLKFVLYNNINFQDESIELAKKLSEAAAKKTVPKF